MTDTGNAYNLTNGQWPPSPPYYRGRLSDGLLWLEYLPFVHVQNYAFIGATIDNDKSVSGTIPFNRTVVDGVRQQIVQYLKTNDLTMVDLHRTTFVIWAGTNDYLNDANITANAVITSLLNAASDLLVAEVSNIILINQPPLDRYPIIAKSNAYIDLGSRILEHNRYIISNLSEVANSYNFESVRVFDVHSLISKLLDDNSTGQFLTSDPCWIFDNRSVLLSACSNPDRHIFIDDFHLTTKVHELIAKQFRQFLISSSRETWPSLKLFLLLSLFLSILNIGNHSG